MYRNLAVVQQKIYSYLTRFKNVAFHAIFSLRTTTKGPPPRCLPQGPHHPKSTPVYLHDIQNSEKQRIPSDRYVTAIKKFEQQ